MLIKMVTYAQLKATAVDRKIAVQWIDYTERYWLAVIDGSLVLETNLDKVVDAVDIADFEAIFKPPGNNALMQVTEDRRIVGVTNRIPAGHTIYLTGKADGITSTPGYRNGDSLIFDANNKVKRFQLMGHWYGIGSRLIWEGADLEDYMSASLIAPATVGTNTTGDFNKVALGGGANVYVPAAPGTGAWTLDLTEKHTSTQVLKCTPVPKAGNTGFFDYNSSTNVLTVNYTQTGGYNLYDFSATLLKFASHCWGRKQDGCESALEIQGIIAKLLFNSWVIDFTLTTAKTSGIKVGLIMTTAVKGNV